MEASSKLSDHNRELTSLEVIEYLGHSLPEKQRNAIIATTRLIESSQECIRKSEEFIALHQKVIEQAEKNREVLLRTLPAKEQLALGLRQQVKALK